MSLPPLGGWIGPDWDPRNDIGIWVFRKTITAGAGKQTLWITADQRYRLYLNGELITYGPQRGDLDHWFVDPVELSLTEGENLIHVVVWSFGRWAPMFQHTARPGLSCGGLTDTQGWEIAEVKDRDFGMFFSGEVAYYIDVGPGELGRAPIPFEALGRAQLEWKKPNGISGADWRPQGKGGTPWNLLPRSIPPQRLDKGPSLAAKDKLIDVGELRVAFPRFRLKGPVGTEIRVTYQEAMIGPNGKGNRNETAGKRLDGYQDRVILGEGETVFEPLWLRTFRFIGFEGPLESASVDLIETGYPYEVESSFDSSDPETAKLWEVSVRTAKLCAGETYYDCPYYEQLQYIGDTRIQALLHSYLSQDRKLQRNAIETLSWSALPEGLLKSRYPSRQTQVIPPFSLFWILMVRDAWMHDPEFDPKPYLPRAKAILDWFDQNQAGWWFFSDWIPGWDWGEAPKENQMHELTLKLAQCAYFEMMDQALPELSRQTIGNSEHEWALWRLLQRVHGQTPDPWPTVEPAVKATFYWQFYKHAALEPSNYFSHLKPWRDQLAIGLTTFAENPEPTRSDCHAWSAHPAYGFLRYVAGVSSAAPGWKKARIEPKPGALEWFCATVAHPQGDLKVKFGEGKLEIETPIESELVWKGKVESLAPGRHTR